MFSSKSSKLSEFQKISKIFDEYRYIYKEDNWYLKNVDRESNWEDYKSGKLYKDEYKKVS